MPKKKSKPTKKPRSTKRSQPPASEIPTINDKELELLRIFKAVDILSRGSIRCELDVNTVIVDGKTACQLEEQLRELSQREVLFCAGPIIRNPPPSIYVIRLEGTNTGWWRKRVSEILLNT